MTGLPFFITLGNILLHVFTTFCLSSHLFTDTWVASTSRLLWIMLLWTWAYKYLHEIPLSILLDVYPEAELLDHTVILCVIFWGTMILFSTVTTSFSIPTISEQGIPYLHILTTTCYFLGFSFYTFLLKWSDPWEQGRINPCIIYSQLSIPYVSPNS